MMLTEAARRPGRWMDALIARLPALLLAAAFLLPTHELPWLGFHGELCAAAALMVLTVRLMRSDPLAARRWPKAALFIAGLSLVPLAQYAFGVTALLGDALMSALYLGGLAVAIKLAAASNFTRSGEAGDLVAAVVLASLLSSLIAFLQFAGLWMHGPVIEGVILQLGKGSRAFGNLAQPNLLASLLILGLIACLYANHVQRLRWPICAVFCVLQIWALVLTQSRTGQVQLAALLALLWIFGPRIGIRASRRDLTLLALAFALGLLAMLALPAPTDSSPVRALTDARSVSTRLLHWQTLGDAVLTAPWWGYGWNQTAVAQAQQVLAHPASYELVEHAHNLLLDLALWNGIPLALVLVVSATVWLAGLSRQMRHPTGFFVGLAILTLLMHAMVEFPLDYFFFLLPMGLLLGLLCSLSSAPMVCLPRWLPIGFCALLAFMTGTVVRDYRVLSAELAELRGAFATPTVLQAPNEERRIWVLTQLEAQAALLRLTLSSAPTPQALQQAEQTSMRYGFAPVLMRLTQLAHKMGDEALAERSLRRLCATQGRRICAEARASLERGSVPPATPQNAGVVPSLPPATVSPQ